MPFTLWFTGLPQSGKTTLARIAEKEFRARGLPSQVLDGDEIREVTGFRGFSSEDRRRHALYVAYCARLLNDHGVFVAVALVSPYRNDRQACRAIIGSAFVECFVQCPASVCASRDRKDLYTRAQEGRLLGLTGLDSPYEIPDHPELTFLTEHEDQETCRRRIVDFLENRHL